MEVHIYKLICNHCGSVYVGSTRDSKGLLDRLYNHHSDSKRKKSKLYVHMNEIGQQNFMLESIIDIVVNSDEERFLEEQKYIEQFNSIENGLNTRAAYCSTDRKKGQAQLAHARSNQRIKNDPVALQRVKASYAKYREKVAQYTYSCQACNYSTNRPDSLKRHKSSNKHLANSIET